RDFYHTSHHNHQAFHSFPTRRSSDLIVEMAVDQLPEKYKVVYMLKELEDLGITEISASLGLSTSNVKVRLHRAKTMMKDAIFKIDRKSTRLNSSHVKISYAVFCLKKK